MVFFLLLLTWLWLLCYHINDLRVILKLQRCCYFNCVYFDSCCCGCYCNCNCYCYYCCCYAINHVNCDWYLLHALSLLPYLNVCVLDASRFGVDDVINNGFGVDLGVEKGLIESREDFDDRGVEGTALRTKWANKKWYYEMDVHSNGYLADRLHLRADSEMPTD